MTGFYPWLLVALLWGAGLLNYLDRQVIFSLFPLLEKDLHLSPTQLGSLSLVFLWVYGLLSPFAGYLADRFGRVRVIVVSLCIWSAVTWATGLARNYEELVLTRAFMGLSEACYIPAALALIADQHGDRTRSLATGLHQSGIYMGIIAGGAGGGYLGEHYGWRYPFALLGAIGVVYGFILFFGLRRAKSGAPRESGRGFAGAVAEVSRLQGYWTLASVFTMVSIASWVITTWLPAYLFERFNMSLTGAGFSATFYIQAGSFAGILLGGIAADRLSARTPRARLLTQTVGLAALAPFLFVIGFTASLPLLTAALLIYGIGRGVYDGNCMPALCDIARPELRATGYGIFNLLSCLAGGVAAAGAGTLKSVIGLDAAFQIGAGIVAAAAILLGTLKPRRQPAAAALAK